MPGIELDISDLRILIDLLSKVGRAEDVHLAGRLENALQSQAFIELSPSECETLLDVLDDPPRGLVEFRGVLARGYREPEQ